MAHLRPTAALLCIAVAAIAEAQETDADVAKGFENLKQIYALAQALDTRLLLGTGVPTQHQQLDPWGTPYRIEAYAADKRTAYRIVGAGKDKQFEDPAKRENVQFAGVDGDVVLDNGRMVRSNRNWLYARVTPGSAAATELAAVRKAELTFMMLRAPAMQKATVINLTAMAMEDVAARIEKYRTEHGSLASLAPPYDAMATLIGPGGDPTQRLTRDGWGTLYDLRIEGETWRLVSAGADRTFDPESWTKPSAADPAEDIVLEKGGFTRKVDFARMFEKTPPEVEVIAQAADPSLAGAGRWLGPDSSITPPVVVQRIEPAYPEDYRQVRIAGIVILQIAISETGAIDDIRVLKSKAPELDMAAVTAVRRWTFQPAMQAGKPVPALYSLTINFTLK